MVANGEISSDEYMQKLSDFVQKKTNNVKAINNQYQIKAMYDAISIYYKK